MNKTLAIATVLIADALAGILSTNEQQSPLEKLEK